MKAAGESYIKAFTEGEAFLGVAWNLWIQKSRIYIIIAVFLYFKQMDERNKGHCVFQV